MIRVTVDTNVLISATFWSGDSEKIIELVEKGEIELVLSVAILREYAEVLQYKEIQDKIRDKNLRIRRSIQKIASISICTYPKEKVHAIEEDTDDNRILECAIAGNVDYLITQDKHLLKLAEYQGIKIITPKELLKKI